MRQADNFVQDILDRDVPERKDDVLFLPGPPTGVRVEKGAAVIAVPFFSFKGGWSAEEPDWEHREIVVRAYGDDVVRVSLAVKGRIPGDKSPMLAWHPTLKPEPLKVRKTATGWDLVDSRWCVRLRVDTTPAPVKEWSKLQRPNRPRLAATIYPDGKTAVPLMAYDTFFADQLESVSLGYAVNRTAGRHARTFFSLQALAGEKFAGTGERFARMNLAGRTFVLENTDALGVNNRRAYKNVPFYVSSRPYGLFVHTSAPVRLSLADVSTRAAQGAVEDDVLDLFVIGGGGIERILYHYRRITGFPPELPLWSYGTWMSRMTYFSAEECRTVARKLREGDFPCDVLHLDTGWFKTDWVCEWEFGRERFPDPAGFMREMKDQGFRITLWQLPAVAKDSLHYKDAVAHRHIPPKTVAVAAGGSNFSAVEYGGTIDFTRAETVTWYQGLLRRLLKMGASAIKTDFGEKIDMDCQYANLEPRLLRNLYALLYQKAAFEVTKQVTGEGIVWARAGWAGCQRYPLHWGGDSACTWDGLAGSIRGGLHLGLSGFAYWSHDVPGFHGIPDFMNSWPSDKLYVRWSQFGVFSSHLRYHGTSPREPYEYPNVAPTVRKWLKLRYALIPYLLAQGRKASRTGYPVLRALVFHHADDPLAWELDDQFYCGDAFLVAPVLNDAGVRDVYLPAGRWVDFWTGKTLEGQQWLRGVKSPLDRMPLYAKRGAKVPVYPEPVSCTDRMDMSKVVTLTFDKSYRGVRKSVLGKVTGL